jgi:xanthine dehydrogenase YagS FAD-binding subunit
MRPFDFQRANDPSSAIAALSGASAKFLGGGTNLIDLMKNGVESPARLVDIHRLGLDKIEQLLSGGLRIGATATNADTANHPLVRQHYPMLSRAILSGASPQLRNMATNGGNLLQRTRCAYFMDLTFTNCNKRAPGSGCSAREGYTRMHAILGDSEQCIATHPSDMCVALAALEARIHVVGPRNAERIIAMEDFHRLPGNTPNIDTNLRADELITAIELSPNNFAAHSHYLKVRDRASYEFALVSVAAALDLDGGTIRTARFALGGVAHKPWRSKEAEQMLAGQAPSVDLFASAANRALAGAAPKHFNAFKVELAKRSVVRALSIAGGLA